MTRGIDYIGVGVGAEVFNDEGKLSAVPESEQCGVSRQIVSTSMDEMMKTETQRN